MSTQKLTDDILSLPLETYLESQGFYLEPPHSEKNEGFITKGQKKQFSEILATYPPITSAIEIGLNAGHSADHLLQTCSSLKQFVSFDISRVGYRAYAVEYLSIKYAGIFNFIEGDSKITISEYSAKFPEQKFDLIYIDGGHAYECCISDIQSCKKLAHPATMIWIDDYHLLGPSQAILGAQVEGLIEVIAYHQSSDEYGKRFWAEARYLC